MQAELSENALTVEEIFNSPPEDNYDEEWKVILSSKGEYILNKVQAVILKQAIATGQKAVIFKTFTIQIPYIVEFFLVSRFIKGTRQLPATASETEYQPIPEDKWEEFKKKIYEKLKK